MTHLSQTKWFHLKEKLATGVGREIQSDPLSSNARRLIIRPDIFLLHYKNIPLVPILRYPIGYVLYRKISCKDAKYSGIQYATNRVIVG